MKIWLSKNSGIPVRDQLITQIIVAIVSGDLGVGDKLASTREIARRFHIHANTVSVAYKKLADEGWLEFRKGSGFYIRAAEQADIDREMKLERLISELFDSGRTLGFSERQIRERLKRRRETSAPERILVIESDRGLREIIASEIAEFCGREVWGIGREELSGKYRETAAVFTAMMDERPKIEALIPPEKKCVYLRSRSVSETMAGHPRPPGDAMIAVVSGWNKFLLMAKTILVAAKIDPGSLIVQQTDEPGWKRGLDGAALIICDSLTARYFPKNEKVRQFRIVSDESLAEIENALSVAN